MAVATAGAIATVACVVLAMVLSLVAGQTWAVLVQGHAVEAGLFAISLSVVGAVVLHRFPRHGLGWLFLGIAVVEGVDILATGLSLRLAAAGSTGWLAGWLAWLGGWLWLAGYGAMLSLVAVLFPDGVLPSPRWRVLVWTAVGALLVGCAAAAVHPGPGEVTAAAAAGDPSAAGEPPTVAAVALGVLIGCGLVGTVGLAVRTARARGARRRQLGWFFAVMASLFFSLAVPGPLVHTVAVVVLLPVGLGVAMLRHGLFDADRLIGPTVTYLALTVLIIAAMAVTAGLVGGLVGGQLTAAVVTALVVALALTPTRLAVQRVVDRLVFGGRSDPYRALAGLGQRLAAVGEPDALPGEIVTGVAQALRVPYAALQVIGEDQPVAVHGVPAQDGAEVSVPVRHAGQQVGTLTVGLRRGRRLLDPADERLLHDFAAQCGPAVQGVVLVRELRRSRDSVVDERDAERARIRRDLHDGLGPVLAGVALGIEAAARAPDRSAGLLTQLSGDVHTGLADVRRIVDDLRPTELDIGFLPAVRRFTAAVADRSGGSLQVEVDAPGGPVRLPERVEVAGYRIVTEAVTNVVRHAQATHCQVGVRIGPDLCVQIRDNGRGVPAGAVAGIGRESMLRRATDLGGSCTITPAPGGGTLVSVLLPLREPGADHD
ncbi:MAG TPA: GAF domain-containing sensor histidine kinase [Nakamurella sp.]